MPVHPITFSISECKIVPDLQYKTKFISGLIPGDYSTYIYNTETEYYNEYKSSLFAITTKKSGWDCMRHYEIIACGTIPYFPNIEDCPENTMALLPKDLIKQGNVLYEEYVNTPIENIDMTKCNKLINELLDYTRNNLTTVKMAQYILNKVGSPNAAKILYLSEDTSPDYLRCVTLHGFKALLGRLCHDYPTISHIYKSDDIDYSNLYGRGITYSNLLNTDLHDNTLDSSIEDDIINRRYDLIIYGSYHRGTPYYDLACSIYPMDKIILLCGEDIHDCNYSEYVNRGHHVFVREL